MTGIILGILSAGSDAALAAFVSMVATFVSLSTRAALMADVDAGHNFHIAHPPQVWAAP